MDGSVRVDGEADLGRRHEDAIFDCGDLDHAMALDHQRLGGRTGLPAGHEPAGDDRCRCGDPVDSGAAPGRLPSTRNSEDSPRVRDLLAASPGVRYALPPRKSKKWRNAGGPAGKDMYVPTAEPQRGPAPRAAIIKPSPLLTHSAVLPKK